MKIINKYLIISLIFTILTSCGIFRKNVKVDIEELENEEYDESIRIDKEALMIADSLNKNSLSFKTFTASFSGNYESDDQNLPLKGVIRIKNDQFIWISLRPVLSIEIGRALFTRDSIKYLDRMKNEYFAESYSYIHKNFGFEMNYTVIESAITNKFFAYPPGNTVESYFLTENESVKANTLNAAGIFSNINMSHSINFSDINYYITENKLKLLDKNRKATFIYSNFTDIYGTKFPHNILIKISDNSKTSSINIKYSSIIKNKEFDLNFKIPKNYKQLHFE
ncbi:MAG: DUF4292 domain-containing protein [Bacteroidales bacterium]|nr:DUF4292 domain-containing protein [Bacteroidales bacterium]